MQRNTVQGCGGRMVQSLTHLLHTDAVQLLPTVYQPLHSGTVPQSLPFTSHPSDTNQILANPRVLPQRFSYTSSPNPRLRSTTSRFPRRSFRRLVAPRSLLTHGTPRSPYTRPSRQCAPRLRTASTATRCVTRCDATQNCVTRDI